MVTYQRHSLRYICVTNFNFVYLLHFIFLLCAVGNFRQTVEYMYWWYFQ